MPDALQCEWRIYYDRYRDLGIVFWNEQNDCRLATTFRSIENPFFSGGNDTVLQVLHQQLETSCTESASETSSRFFIIDSLQNGINLAARSSSGSGLYKLFYRGLHLLKARQALERVVLTATSAVMRHLCRSSA